MAKLNPEEIPAEQSSERQGGNRNENLPGLWRHKDSGKELVAYATAAADAYYQVGFRFVRDLEDTDFPGLLPDPEEPESEPVAEKLPDAK